IEAAKKEMGLDLPVWKQYFHYLNDLSPIHLSQQETPRGRVLFAIGTTSLSIQFPYLRSSYQSKKPVTLILLEAMEGTAMLALSSICLAMLLGISAGVVSALFYERWPDRLLLAISTLGISLPSFFAAI